MKFLEDLKTTLEELKSVTEKVEWASVNVPDLEDCVDGFVSFDGDKLRIETCLPDPDIKDGNETYPQISHTFTVYGKDGNSIPKEHRLKCAALLREIADKIELDGRFYDGEDED